MIRIIVSEQMLYHRRKTGVVYAYPISTSAKGVGNEEGSFKTPLGRHRVREKIGDECPLNTIFVSREPKGVFKQKEHDENADFILTRILRLDGCQVGVNKRGHVDTYARYIYIHGTHDEQHIGQEASHGCIRMRNGDIMQLFEHVSEGESVFIKP